MNTLFHGTAIFIAHVVAHAIEITIFISYYVKMVKEKSMSRNMQSPGYSLNDDLLKDDSPQERPPVFRTWRRLYLAVLGNLILLIVIFYILTRMFS